MHRLLYRTDTIQLRKTSTHVTCYRASVHTVPGPIALQAPALNCLHLSLRPCKSLDGNVGHRCLGIFCSTGVATLYSLRSAFLLLLPLALLLLPLHRADWLLVS